MTLDIVALTNAQSPQAEAYRSLRTNLDFYSLENPLHTLLIASPEPDDDKTKVVANLGVISAQGGKRVILVDADMRRPRLHDVFGVNNHRGLATALAEEEGDLPLVDTAVPNLRILPAGPTPVNPADLLASHRMNDVLEQLKGMADVILFDAPPLVAVTDGALLAARVDGVLLVARAGQTRRELVERARDILGKVKANLVGAVLTNAAVETGVYKYYGE
ncbi:MAG TPA: CpsD/CapB family tyrosine-protein kinase [Caldilineae bacterium]|nr:CpsD/CapB family tyrosine-protein kinase [Caldilineae bacterium]